jgi:hypothetical protein
VKPTFQELYKAYPRTDSREKLLADLGWQDLIPNKAYEDTCAIRLSTGLVRAGVLLPGARRKAKAGENTKGRYIEPGQAKLSHILKRLWGEPEIYKTEMEAQAGIGNRRGVVSFFQIMLGSGGHIDLIFPGERGYLACARSCFFVARSIWFWPLK